MRWSGPKAIVGCVWPRHSHCGRPLNSVVMRHDRRRRYVCHRFVGPRCIPSHGTELMPSLPSSNPKQFVQGAPVLHVPDVVATATFYRDVLGFTWDFGDETYAVVWRDNSAIHFVSDKGNPKGVHLFQCVKDIDSYYKEILARGAEVATAPK